MTVGRDPKDMAQRKEQAVIEAAVSLAAVFGILWAFDRPFARVLLERFGWIGVLVAAVAVATVLPEFAARRTKASQTPGSLSHSPKTTYPRNSTLGLTASGSNPSASTEAWSLDLIRELEWKRFEMLCAGFYDAKGYHPKTTRIGADGGIDIVLYRKSAPAGRPFGVVQCKAWSNRPVGIKPIRELFGVKAAENAPLAVFMTTTDYTDEAKGFAKGKHLELISGTKLVELLQGLPEPSGSELLRKVTSGDYTTPTCPHCDIKMVLRTSRKGNNVGHSFWGCKNYPRCHQTLNMATTRNSA